VGGILAVIWTDAIQAIVLMVGALVSLAIMLATIPGGIGYVLDVAREADKFSLGESGLQLDGARVVIDLGSATIVVVLLYGLAINLQNFGIDQSYVQRYIASSSDQEARRSLWLGGLLYVPISALFFFIGTTLFAYYQAPWPSAGQTEPAAAGATHRLSELDEVRLIVARQRLLQKGMSADDPDFSATQSQLAQELSLADIGDRVFPHFIAKHLPPGITGLLIAAVFAAAMSTVSTSLNSSATLIMSDYYRRFIHPAASPRQSMLVLYAATVAWGVLGTTLALLLVRLTDSALDIWWTLSGIFGGGMTGLFLLGMISRRARNAAGVTGVLAGIVMILWLSLPKMLSYLTTLPPESTIHRLAVSLQKSTAGWASPFDAFMVPVFGTLAILFVGLVVSSLPVARHDGRR
jgi:SSS family solute:Na+ symporter